MTRFAKLVAAVALLLALGATHALADSPLAEGAAVSVNTRGIASEYPVLNRGRVLLINAQRFVVTQEPHPSARVSEPPPEPLTVDEPRPTPPSATATWVPGHWIYGPTGFSWVDGRYVAQRAGHVFVPPRWASLEDEYLFFTGFYVPHGVYVRSHFNRYYFSGMPNRSSRSGSGPYWPIGAAIRSNRPLTSANVRDPYWPIGAPR